MPPRRSGRTQKAADAVADAPKTPKKKGNKRPLSDDDEPSTPKKAKTPGNAYDGTPRRVDGIKYIVPVDPMAASLGSSTRISCSTC